MRIIDGSGAIIGNSYDIEVEIVYETSFSQLCVMCCWVVPKRPYMLEFDRHVLMLKILEGSPLEIV